MKSVITDLVYAFGSNTNQHSGNILDNETTNDAHEEDVDGDILENGRRRSGFRRRRTTTTIEGPTGAPPLGSVSMVGAAGGGPAAWAAAAFGRGDERKVQKITSYLRGPITLWAT